MCATVCCLPFALCFELFVFVVVFLVRDYLQLVTCSCFACVSNGFVLCVVLL